MTAMMMVAYGFIVVNLILLVLTLRQWYKTQQTIRKTDDLITSKAILGWLHIELEDGEFTALPYAVGESKILLADIDSYAEAGIKATFVEAK